MAGTGLYQLPLLVHPENGLDDLIPGYLAHRQDDVAAIDEALTAGDLAPVQSIGHSMKGSGGGYGFDGITEIGLRLEEAARDGEADTARAALADLRDYLSNVEVHYG